MLNREKLLNTNMYDLLMKWNKYLLDRGGMCCIIEMLENKKPRSRYSTIRCMQYQNKCEDCIQAWLNSEERVNV